MFRNAKIYISQEEVGLISGKVIRQFLFLKHHNKLPVSNYKTLSDGDSVVIGNVLVHAISTPGHTIGAMCFRVDEMLFTGDLCMLVNGVVQPMIKIFTEDMAMDSQSIRKIAILENFKAIYTPPFGICNRLFKCIFRMVNHTDF